MITDVNYYGLRMKRAAESMFVAERWLGKLAAAAGGKVTSKTSLVSFQAATHADADTFGTAVLVMDSNDTPNVVGMNAFAFKRMRVSAVGAADKTFRIRIAYGLANESSYATAVANEHFTEIIATAAGEYIDVHMPLLDPKSKVWVAASKADATSETIDFMFSVIEYEE
jgi:hypothetical protein